MGWDGMGWDVHVALVAGGQQCGPHCVDGVAEWDWLWTWRQRRWAVGVLVLWAGIGEVGLLTRTVLTTALLFGWPSS